MSGPSSNSETGKREQIPPSSSFVLFSTLDDADAHWGRWSAFLSPLIRMLMSSRNTPQTPPERMFNLGPVAQSKRYIQLTITPSTCSLCQDAHSPVCPGAQSLGPAEATGRIIPDPDSRQLSHILLDKQSLWRCVWLWSWLIDIRS